MRKEILRPKYPVSHKATVIDCSERCRKMEGECRQIGRSQDDCQKQRLQCRTVCAYK